MRFHVLVALMIVVLPALGRAQDAPPEDRAGTLFERGVERLREGDHEAAAAAFRESYRLAPRVTTMCNLALTYDRWGPEHRAQAARAYRTCARDDDTGRFRTFAEQRVAEIEREIVLSESEPTEHEPPPPEPAPPSEPEITPPPPSDPLPPPEPDHTSLYVGLGLAAPAAGAAITAIVLALDAQSTVDDLRDEPFIVRGSPEHDRLEQARTTATVATALYVTAGVLAAGAATLVIIDLAASDTSETHVAIRPNGIAIEGRF
ncbi:hypothetical protein [Sandaracinus amylolyticus]|uniref:Tetratricopeptide repeat protein n=1 Tax=Sandaracinus amylolyticus TaxID=927083 RepID=A0A0F6W926_9BACT|nr:hypothetical protein [Sandaracinus amylolyticus]AKF10511.1 hypothetical protein DB32_007660 [Sandaracinus amylolyticus]